MNNNNNSITEIGMIVLAALLVIGGVVLIFFGKITFIEFSPFLVGVLGIVTANIAWKAPSPAQAQQLNAQQQQIGAMQQQFGSLQELALNSANNLTAVQSIAHTHAEPVQAPEPPPEPAQYQFVPVNRHFGDTGLVPTVPAKQ